MIDSGIAITKNGPDANLQTPTAPENQQEAEEDFEKRVQEDPVLWASVRCV